MQVRFSDISEHGAESPTTGSMIATLRAKKRLEGMQKVAAERRAKRESESSSPPPKNRYTVRCSRAHRQRGRDSSKMRGFVPAHTTGHMAKRGWSDSSGPKIWGDTIELVRARETGKRWVIDPRTSVFIARWDLIAASGLVFVALVTPYEVSFLPSATVPDGPWALFVINRLVDFVFLVDLVLQFMIMYPDHDVHRGGVKYVRDPYKIALHYLKSWFGGWLTTEWPRIPLALARSEASASAPTPPPRFRDCAWQPSTRSPSASQPSTSSRSTSQRT